MIRKLTLAGVVAATTAGMASAALTGPGDIAFIGVNADATDNIAFVTLVDIGIGETIGFTDNEWNGTGWTDNNENGFEWTAGANISAGTVITIDQLNPIDGNTLSNLGTVAPIAGAGTNAGVSNSDECLWAFIGPYAAPTAFLTAFGNDAQATVATSLAGTGLTDGVNALFILGDEDVMAYTGPRNNQTSFAAYAAQVNNAANWITQDGSGDQSADSVLPDIPFDTTAFTIPEPGMLSLFALAGLLPLRRRK